MANESISGLMYYDDFVAKATKMVQNTEIPYLMITSDFSDFRYINKLYGFESGNGLLKSFAGFLTEQSKCLIASRTHTDHFVHLYEDTMTDEELMDWVRDWKRRFIESVQKQFPDVLLNLNVGAYRIYDHSEPIIDTVDKSNLARRMVKGNLKESCKIYSSDLLEQKEANAKVSKMFEEELAKGTIAVFMQPKFDIRTQEIVGAEALTRMYDKDRKLVSPGVFIPVLERSGRVVELDMYVARIVFGTIRKWLDMGVTPIPVSLNLSRLHFMKPRFVEELIAEFERYHLPPSFIEFEVTESVFFESKEIMIAKISKLRDYGFHVSVDDFGAGYSSLNMVGILPVDYIKLDRAFIRDSLGTRRGRDIMHGLINILNQINLDVICEGIETKDEENMIFEFGCHKAQGFLYDRPIPLNDFEEKYMRKRMNA